MIGWSLLLLFGILGVAVIERWTTTGKLTIALVPMSSFLQKRVPLPEKRDKIFFNLPPFIMIMAVVLAAAVLPVTAGSYVVNLATGALFFSAALAYVMVALVLSGWAPNTEYAQAGGWRFLGQFIAYSMPLVMTTTAVAMRAESLSTLTIVESQQQLWNIVYQPLGFILFLVSAMAIAFLPPFDLPTADSEIKGGVFSSYDGWRLAAVRIARLTLILTVSWAVAVFYLGGWYGPLLPDWLWSSAKVLAVASLMLYIGRFAPRLTIDNVLSGAWKAAIPLALLNIFIVGVMLLGGIV